MMRVRDLFAGWQQIWFPETTAARLAACRIFLFLFQLWILLYWRAGLVLHLNLVRYEDSFTTPRALTSLAAALFSEEAVRTEGVMTAVYVVTLLAAAAAAVGFFSRSSALISASGHAFLVSHYYSYGELHHPEAVFAICLFFFAASDCGRCYSVDSWLARRRGRPDTEFGPNANTRFAHWPLLLTQVLLGLTYLDAGLSKVYGNGLAWLNGSTLQHYILRDALSHGAPLGVWMGQHGWLVILASYGTLLFEITFILAVATRRLLPLYAISGLVFHATIFLTMRADFFETMALYCVFSEHIRPLFRRLGAHLSASRQLA